MNVKTKAASVLSIDVGKVNTCMIYFKLEGHCDITVLPVSILNSSL